jgi:O-antigen/teichoic acid export membrane protein
MLKTSISNLFLRGCAVASRFAVVMLIARYATPTDMGVYGLMAVTISISLYLLGMDFYVYNTRELLARPESERLPLVRDQMVFHLIGYSVVLPMLLVVFGSGTLSWGLAAWFYLLLIMEHICLETNRLLIAFSRPVWANLALFARAGTILMVIAGLGLLNDSQIGLKTIWIAWFTGLTAGLITGVASLRRLAWRRVLAVPMDWPWIRRGVATALPFLCATIALLGVQYTDRYFLKQYHGESAVGIYTFFASLANVVQVFTFSGITMIMYPRVVAAYQSGAFSEYGVLMRRMAVRIGAAVLVLAGVAALLIRPALWLVGREAYASNLSIFWIMLLSTALFALADIPHYPLYVRGKDRALVLATLVAFLVGLAANVLLVPDHGLTGAATATCCAMAVLLGGKSLLLLHHTRKERLKRRGQLRSKAAMSEEVTGETISANR